MSEMKKRATITDVARLAGVSTGTVSRMLNKNGYVSATAMDNIQKAIAELEYVPSAAARGIIHRNSAIVGIAVPQINNPYLSSLVVQMEELLSKQEFSVMICNTGYNSRKMDAFVDDLIMRDAEGLILIGTEIQDSAVLSKLKNYIQLVSIGTKMEGVDSYVHNDYAPVFDITRHLISLGHTQIAYIGHNSNSLQTMSRLEGYLGALRHEKIEATPNYCLGAHPRHDDGYRLMQQLLELDNPPTAVVAVNDFYALGAYCAIHERDLKIGEDVSVTGFDNIDIAHSLTPPLTTVETDSNNIAITAVNLLCDRICEGYKGEPRMVSGSYRVLIRNSVGKCKM